MNRFVLLSFALLSALVLVLSGCASLEANNTEQLLSAAGFRSRTPSTPQQQELFAAMPPYKLQRQVVNGKVLYTYADPKKGLVFIGGEAEYQRYNRLGLQQQIAQTNLAAAQLNQDASLNYSAWGPWGMWW
jgi:hypothetical protein